MGRSRKLKRLTPNGSFEETKASHSQWVVRGNSASHSQWVVRQVTKVKIIIRKMFKFIFPIKAERK
ncbi:hypothetical protein [Leptospira noguchii]|uniref:hypothetical protein n=1 Tax=Leptospira noguchii TaxID=28182 RepID=UPI0018DED036|nr:hypothetical protein [Leptospira noguchii]